MALPLIGHEQIWQKLTSEPPFAALLFVGPSGIGKQRLALELAAYWNCPQPQVCFAQAPSHGHIHSGISDRCSSCRRILKLQHPDVHLWRREEGKLSLGIGEMRDLIASSSSANYEGKLRFDLIDEAHCLTDEAQTSLLKTLEEPGRRQVLVLITDQGQSLLDTVRSRCRLHRFQPLSVERLAQVLGDRGEPADRATLVANLCQGRVGAALRFLEQPQLFAVQEEYLDIFLSLPGSSLWQSLQAAKAMEQLKMAGDEAAGATAFALSRLSAEAQLQLLRLVVRDLLSLGVSDPNSCSNSCSNIVWAHRRSQLQPIAANTSTAQLIALSEKIHQWHQSLVHNVSPRFVLQNLCIGLAQDLCSSSK